MNVPTDPASGLVAILGGVRATVFAGLAALFLLAAAGFGIAWKVQDARLAACKAEESSWAGAQKTNIETIDGLIDKLDEVTARHAANDKAAGKAVAELEAEKAENAKERVKALKDLRDAQAKSPTARAWGRRGVDRAVADRLPGAD